MPSGVWVQEVEARDGCGKLDGSAPALASVVGLEAEVALTRLGVAEGAVGGDWIDETEPRIFFLGRFWGGYIDAGCCAARSFRS